MTFTPTTLMEIILIVLALIMNATFFYGLGKAQGSRKDPIAELTECEFCKGRGFAEGITYIEPCPFCKGRGVWTDTHGKMEEGKK